MRYWKIICACPKVWENIISGAEWVMSERDGRVEGYEIFSYVNKTFPMDFGSEVEKQGRRWMRIFAWMFWLLKFRVGCGLLFCDNALQNIVQLQFTYRNETRFAEVLRLRPWFYHIRTHDVYTVHLPVNIDCHSSSRHVWNDLNTCPLHDAYKNLDKNNIPSIKGSNTRAVSIKSTKQI